MDEGYGTRYACAELPQGWGDVMRMHTEWELSGKEYNGEMSHLATLGPGQIPEEDSKAMASALLPGSGSLRRRAKSGKVGTPSSVSWDMQRKALSPIVDGDEVRKLP